MMPLINILIRNSFRPDLLIRCLDSIERQDYRKIKAHVLSDTPQAHEHAAAAKLRYYFPIELSTIIKGSGEHYWNLYCNQMMQNVEDGWFFFMDNDDFLKNWTVLSELSLYLDDENKGVIVQFLRNGAPKPKNILMDQKRIERGRVGGGCLVLHSKFKNVATWDDKQAADFRWIKQVQAKVPFKFVKLVMQIAGNGGLHGN